MGSIDCVLERNTEAMEEAKEARKKQGELCFQTTFISHAESGGLSPGNDPNPETHWQSRPWDKFQDTSAKVQLIWSLPPSYSLQVVESHHQMPLTRGSSSLLSGCVVSGQDLEVSLGTRTLGVKAERFCLVPSVVDRALQWPCSSLPGFLSLWEDLTLGIWVCPSH